MKIPTFKLKNSFFLTLGPIFIIILLIVMGRQFIVSMDECDNVFAKANEHLSATKEILFLDETLTNSSRLAILTGDLSWYKKYDQAVKEVDKKIEKIYKFIDRDAHAQSISLTERSNALLVEMEERAMSLAKEGREKEAMSIILGPFYSEQKENYLTGVRKTIRYIQNQRELSYKKIENNFIIRYIMFSGLLVIAITGGLVFLLYSLRSKNKNNFADVSTLYCLRLKKVLAIVATDLRSYVSSCQASYNLMSGRIKSIQHSGWTDDNIGKRDEYVLTEEVHYDGPQDLDQKIL